MATEKVSVKGDEYSITTTEAGWKLVRMVEKTDRFHRKYVIVRGSNGAPRSCSCADWVYRGGVCKHMNAVLDMMMVGSTTEEGG